MGAGGGPCLPGARAHGGQRVRPGPGLLLPDCRSLSLHARCLSPSRARLSVHRGLLQTLTYFRPTNMTFFPPPACVAQQTL